ncbi:MAG TPA: hypothetical protein VKU94_06020 [Geobacterales bacterium]|nr:hypothetical protein [Geobacterales bacterium]
MSSVDNVELPYLAEEFGFKKAYLTSHGSLVLILEKNGKLIYREIDDAWRYIENVNRVEAPLVSDLMLKLLYEKISEVKQEMEREAEQA